jgi:hypothetical protein
MHHFLRQPGDSIDLDHVRRPVAPCDRPAVNVAARSVAAVDTLAQPAIGYCPAQTRQSDRRGSAGAATRVSGQHRGRTSRTSASSNYSTLVGGARLRAGDAFNGQGRGQDTFPRHLIINNLLVAARVVATQMTFATICFGPVTPEREIADAQKGVHY